MSLVNKKELLEWLDEVLPEKNIKLDVSNYDDTQIIYKVDSPFPDGKITHKYNTITLTMDDIGLKELKLEK